MEFLISRPQNATIFHAISSELQVVLQLKLNGSCENQVSLTRVFHHTPCRMYESPLDGSKFVLDPAGVPSIQEAIGFVETSKETLLCFFQKFFIFTLGNKIYKFWSKYETFLF